MSTKDKSVNGFKFSFKKENSAKSTPKFTSIELESQGFTRLQNKSNYQKSQHKNRNNDQKHNQSMLTGSKRKMRRIQMSYSHKNISIPDEEVNYIDKDEQIPKINQSSSKAKITLNVDNKKLIVINRPKIIKSQSFKKMFKTQISVQQQENVVVTGEKQKQWDQQGSYLANYKREKKQMELSKQKLLKHSNVQIKIPRLNLDQLQKRDQSPKSIRSFRETPKIFNKFFPKLCEPQYGDPTNFPTTQKSKKFMEQSEQSTFFRKNETKKNLGVTKGLLKSQKTNVNVRLNNIGGGISKLNIQID